MRGCYTPGRLHSPEDVLIQVFSSLTSTGPLVLSAETVKSLWKLRGRGGKRGSKSSKWVPVEAGDKYVNCNIFSNCLYLEFSLSWGESLWELSISWVLQDEQELLIQCWCHPPGQCRAHKISSPPDKRCSHFRPPTASGVPRPSMFLPSWFQIGGGECSHVPLGVDDLLERLTALREVLDSLLQFYY